MRTIELRVSRIKLGMIFLVNLLCAGILIASNYWESIETSLFIGIVLVAGTIITAFIAALVYYTHPGLIVDPEGIRMTGKTKKILFDDIRRIETGPGALKLTTDDQTVVISNVYTNYKKARKLLNDRINGRNDVTVIEHSNKAVLVVFIVTVF